MGQNVILHGCDFERSRSSIKVNKFSIRPSQLTNKYECKVSSKFYCLFLVI